MPEPHTAAAANLSAVLRTVRQARSNDALSATHLEPHAEVLSSIEPLNRLAASRSVSVSVVTLDLISEAINTVGDLPAPRPLPAKVVRDILSRILVHKTPRLIARKRLVERWGAKHNFGLDALRKAQGIEDRCIRELANHALEVAAAEAPPAEGERPAESRAVRHEELFFGLVLWLGTDTEPTIERMEGLLSEAGFKVEQIKLSHFLNKASSGGFAVAERKENQIGYLTERMDAGDRARELEPSILATMAVGEIRERRHKHQSDPESEEQYRGVAYILDSLMHPAEVELLRETYGSLFFLVAIHEDEEKRRKRLLDHNGMISWKKQNGSEAAPAVIEELLGRNKGVGRRSISSPKRPNLIAVEKVFHQADVFVDVANPTRRGNYQDDDARGLSDFTIDQFIAQIFSNPFNVPTRHEAGMAHAYVESRRSGSVARRVGAGICTMKGDLISVGMNEVPAPWGGQYPQRDLSDGRDHVYSASDDPTKSIDPSDDARADLLLDVISGLYHLGILTPEGQQELLGGTPGEADFTTAAIDLIDRNPELAETRLFDVIEFGRTVHAEMAAILNATSRNQSVEGAVLYCTTFPCHECSRHIIMSGLRRVVYVEPYPKSRVLELHRDAIRLDRGPAEDRIVEFLPFIGIAPRRHSDLYSALPRKQDLPGGRTCKVDWGFATAPIRDTIEPSDLRRKILQFAAIDAMEGAVIKVRDGLLAHLSG